MEGGAQLTDNAKTEANQLICTSSGYHPADGLAPSVSVNTSTALG